MKRTKRISALLLSLVLLVSLCIPASATNTPDISTQASSNDLIVLIPGTMGTELQYGSTKVWDPGTNVLNHSKYFNWLSFGESGSANYSLSVLNDDNYGARDTYQTIYNRLYNTFSSSATVKFFGYDWRYSCTNAANALANLVNGYSGKIILVAHSMGGLVASQYLNNATSSQRSRTTLITLGTPFTGSPKAVNVFETGSMFGLLENMAIGGYIKENAKNYPSAYQLLPTNRHPKYLMKDEVLQVNSSALSFLKTRDWGLTSSGAVKSQFSTASSFISGLGSGTSHKAYLAANTYHIVATGEDTVAKINFVLDAGEYRADYLEMSNAGDGTVLAESARNSLAANNSIVFTYSNCGDHTGMLNNSTILNKVVSLINGARSTSSLTEVQNVSPDAETLNSRGWIVGDNYDNRRIIINLNHTDPGKLSLSSGESVYVDGEKLFFDDVNGSPSNVGYLLKTGIGYQYVLKNNAYLLDCSDISSEASLVIRYLNDGYYEKITQYDQLPDSISVSISDYSEMEIQALDTNTLDGITNPSIVPIAKEYSPVELTSINSIDSYE